MDKPLDFLGLYKTHNDASSRQQIPARVISGDTSETQILVAGQRYLDRPTVLESILNDLFHVLRYENCKDLRRALDILLLAMESHLHEKHIQISGSASLYYIVKSDQLKRDWNIKVSSILCSPKIILLMFDGFLGQEAHSEDFTECHALPERGSDNDAKWLSDPLPISNSLRCYIRLQETGKTLSLFD